MNFPYVTAATAGVLLILQMALGLAVSGARGQADIWVGDAGHGDLIRVSRRHANLAENAGIFVVALLILEISGRFVLILEIAAAVFIAARVLHAIGLSRLNTNNPFRLAGGVITYLDGIALGAMLLFIAVQRQW